MKNLHIFLILATTNRVENRSQQQAPFEQIPTTSPGLAMQPMAPTAYPGTGFAIQPVAPPEFPGTELAMPSVATPAYPGIAKEI